MSFEEALNVRKENLWYEPGKVDTKTFFVGYQYKPRYFTKDHFKCQIKKALRETGLNPYFYDDHFGNDIVTRKILKKIHGTAFSVFDLSDGNPNVLIEVGFALGVNRDVFILKHKGSDFKIPSDIDPIERIDYGDLIDLEKKLRKAFLDSKLGREK